MAITNVKGDLLESDADIIAHQVNCLGVMGGGVAAQIKERYPKVNEAYVDYVDSAQRDNCVNRLGDCQLVRFDGNRFFANLFGQNLTGAGRQTNYEALNDAMEDLAATARNMANVRKERIKIAMPKNIGCGLAGGNWKIVERIIESVFEEEIGIDVEIVEWNK